MMPLLSATNRRLLLTAIAEQLIIPCALADPDPGIGWPSTSLPAWCIHKR